MVGLVVIPLHRSSLLQYLIASSYNGTPTVWNSFICDCMEKDSILKSYQIMLEPKPNALHNKQPLQIHFIYFITRSDPFDWPWVIQ
jgi:hypothetical protein